MSDTNPDIDSVTIYTTEIEVERVKDEVVDPVELQG